MKFYNDEWELFIHNCGFTDDEYDIVQLLRRGWYSADIAEHLNVSLRTVQRKRKSITQKITRFLLKQGQR